jgi:hypothetical protein
MTPLSAALIGTWELISREDRNAAGELRLEPTLGPDPLGLLIYDRGGRFAAQFMKRDRATTTADTPAAAQSANNTRAKDGYDAYFGTYVVDDARRTVTQTLHAALSAENVGHVVTREMAVEGDTLTISLDTTSVSGEAVTRTLRWRRVA